MALVQQPAEVVGDATPLVGIRVDAVRVEDHPGVGFGGVITVSYQGFCLDDILPCARLASIRMEISDRYAGVRTEPNSQQCQRRCRH